MRLTSGARGARGVLMIRIADIGVMRKFASARGAGWKNYGATSRDGVALDTVAGEGVKSFL